MGITDDGPDGRPSDLLKDVINNLQSLLNTRTRPIPLDSTLEQLSRSPVSFGLTDYAGTGLSIREARVQIAKDLLDAIERFEPRLKYVNVQPIGEDDPDNRSLRFRIEGVLRTGGSVRTAERIALEGVLRPSQGGYEVGRWGGRR